MSASTWEGLLARNKCWQFDLLWDPLKTLLAQLLLWIVTLRLTNLCYKMVIYVWAIVSSCAFLSIFFEFCSVLLQNRCSFYQTRFWIRKFCAFLKKTKAFSLSYPQWCNVWLTPFGIWLMLSELADLLQNILWKLSKYPGSTMLLFSYNEIVKVFVSEKLHKNQHTKEWG